MLERKPNATLVQLLSHILSYVSKAEEVIKYAKDMVAVYCSANDLFEQFIRLLTSSEEILLNLMLWT